MPTNLVKTAKDEELWARAKQLSKDPENYALVNHIYQRMKAAKAKE